MECGALAPLYTAGALSGPSLWRWVQTRCMKAAAGRTPNGDLTVALTTEHSGFCYT